MKSPKSANPEKPASSAKLPKYNPEELLNDLQRTRADFENYRKQIDLQKSQIAAITKEETIKKFSVLFD